MKNISIKTSIQKIYYFKPTNYIVIGIFILGCSFILGRFIDVGFFMIIILLFSVLSLFFIVGIETSFIIFIVLTFIPFKFAFSGVEGWAIQDFLTPILLFLIIGQCTLKGEPLNRVPRFYIPLLLFLFISLAHILTLQEFPKIVKNFLSFTIPTGSFRIYYDIIICGILYFITPFLFKKESHIKMLLKLLGGVLIFLIIFSFLRIYLGIDNLYTNELFTTRIHHVDSGDSIVPRIGIMGRAGYLLFIIGLIFVKNRSNILFLLLSGICIAGVVVSGGRATFLALVFAISLYIYLKGKKIIALVFPIGLLLVLFFFGLNPKIASNLPPILYRHLTIFSSENPSLSRHENTRLEMWNISWGIITEHPFWGARSVDNKAEYNDISLINVMKGEAHNTYLSIAAGLGLPALVLWLIVAVSYFKKIINLYEKTIFSPLLNKFCLLLAIILGVSFITFFFEGNIVGGIKYFLYLGLIDSASNIYNNKHESFSE